MTESQRGFAEKFQNFKKYTSDEFFEIVKDTNELERYELLNGIIYMMAGASFEHQDIAGNIYTELRNYLNGKKCRPGIAPIDVVLFEKNQDGSKAQNVFQPDVFVICDPDKIINGKIYGAPDFVAEVISRSNSAHDYFYKLTVYMTCGVKEYWIVNQFARTIEVFINDTKNGVEHYTYAFSDTIKVSIFDDFSINFNEIGY